MPDEQLMLRRQQVLADFGDFALRSDNLDVVLTAACRLVGEALGTNRAKILEIQESGDELLVRAGVGWDPEVVGKVRLQMNERSSESFSIREGKPVVSQNIREERRFQVPAFMKSAGVIAMVNVPIFVPGPRAYGLLQVDANEPREFGQDEIEFLRTYSTILGPVIDRLQKVGSLRKNEERFRAIVETARDYAIFTTDAQDRIDGWYAGAEAVFGWAVAEAVGQPGSIVFTPEDRAAAKDTEESETARRDGAAPNVRWHLRKDGKRVFIEGVVRALYDDSGEVRGFAKIGQDVTQRRLADERLHHNEAELRDSEERFRHFGEASQDILWIRNAKTLQWLYLTPAFEAIYGISREEALLGDNFKGWLGLVFPDDRVRVREAIERACAGERVSFEYRIRRPKGGEIRWMRDLDFAVRNAAGEVLWVGGIGRDVTEEKHNAERMDVLVAELQHRTRNLIGVVSSLADKTLRSSADLAEFRLRFRDRLNALARVQGLLSRLNEMERVTFGDLLRFELSAMGEVTGKISLKGAEDIRMRSSTVQTLAMALHELATNAVKYGALAQPAGRLSVTWELEAEGESGQPWLHIDWRESGVEMPSSGAERRRGQGRDLIEHALPYQLNAKTFYALGTDGVHCTISMPVSASTTSGADYG